MQAVCAAPRACFMAPRTAAPTSKRNAPSRRRLLVVKAQSDEDKAAALKAALEQAQANPETAAKMKQMEEAMSNPAVQAQMGSMMSAMNNPAFMQKMAELRDDPDLKPIFDEIRSGGMAAMMKYMNDPDFLAKIGAKMGDAIPDAPAAPATPPPPPEVNNILDAAKLGDIEAIEDFMAVGKGGEKDGQGRTALHYAVAYDRAPAVKALLDCGFDPNEAEQAQNTALHYAAGYGREECVRLLLAAGADVSRKNDKGQTAAEVVKDEQRNPINQQDQLMAVLEGSAEPATILS